MTAVGDISITVRKAAEDLQKLKVAYEGGNDAACDTLLAALRSSFIHFPTFLNPSAESKMRKEELMLTREALEIGCLLQARKQNLEHFELYFSQLQVYYSDVSRADLSESPRLMMMLGLHLITLLVMSRIAQFHSEIEKIPHAEHGSNSYIRFAVLLERYLMEGSYNKLLNARKKAPCNEYLPVLAMLEATVRSEVADCIPHAYNSLSVSAAQKVLMESSQDKVLATGQTNGWKLDANHKKFVFERDEDVARFMIPFQDMIEKQISIAADMQNIV